LSFKTKITALGRDSCGVIVSLRSSFRQRPDAARAQGLANQFAVLQNTYFLKIGAKSSSGGPQGEAAVITKGCGFTTSIALSHSQGPFL
jgi:hypothetical protein